MTKYLLLTALGLAFTVGLTMAVDFRSRPEVTIHPVSDSTPLIHAPGRVEGASENLELRASLPGRVVRLLVKEGQMVEADDVLLELEDDELAPQRDLAAAELAVTEGELLRLRNGCRQHEKDEVRSLLEAKTAELRRAEANWQRTSGLRKENSVTAQDADQQRAEVDVLQALVGAARARCELLHAPPRSEDVQMAEARVQSARAKLALAQARLDRTRLKAPFSGQLLKIDVQVGDLAGPESAEPAVVLCNTSHLRVRAFIEEFEALRIVPGARATISADGLSGRTLQGTVSRLAPQMTNKLVRSDRSAERIDTKIREVWIDLDDAGEAVPGLPVEVVVENQARPSQVVQQGSRPLQRESSLVAVAPTGNLP